MIQPKECSEYWLEKYFCSSLMSSAPYSLEQEVNMRIKLDQNENPFDWPDEVKQTVLEKVFAASWNRYPQPFSERLDKLIGEQVGVPPECILTGPGSNHQITLIFDAIGPNIKGKMVIARPSFALFESQCRYSNIPYETWDLNKDLEYDLKALPNMPNGSFLVFASPNNPTGSILSQRDLKTILEKNPESLVLADEAYFEFSDEGYQELLSHHSNLIILRTLSKTMGAAGLRIGYILSNRSMIAQLSKRRLPYLLNHFTMAATEVVLTDPRMKSYLIEHIEHVRTERKRIFDSLAPWSKKNGHRIKPSEANFLILQCSHQTACDEIYHNLKKACIIVRNISKAPMLEGCLRLSVGSQDENQALIQTLIST